MKRQYLIITALSIAALGVGSFGKWPLRMIYNPTESAPRGYYLMVNTTVKKDDYVLTNIPEKAKYLAIKRQYLPDGVPLLKPVAAQSGDHICIKHDQVFINYKPVASLLKQDSSGRKLIPWMGCRLLEDNEFFLLSTYVPHSFDSRYFGPITGEMIIGKAVPLWVFDSER